MSVSNGDRVALQTVYVASDIASMPHSMDNSFLDVSYAATCRNMAKVGKFPSGTCWSVGYERYQHECAFIYFNLETDRLEWIHISRRILEYWEEECNYG